MSSARDWEGITERVFDSFRPAAPVHYGFRKVPRTDIELLDSLCELIFAYYRIGEVDQKPEAKEEISAMGLSLACLAREL